MSDIGPIEIEVIRNALAAAANEMDVTIWRTSRSTIVRELLDYSTAVFAADGDNLAQSARIPMHLNSMGAALRAILDRYIPLDEWRPGDIVITNDPYCGAQHLPDILAIKAVFAEGRRVAFVGTLCHHIDVGGQAAGSYGATATEIFQEGMRIPPVKLFEGGKRNDALWQTILQNVRKPDLLAGDLKSQFASLAVGEAALARLAGKYGAEVFLEAGKRILDMSEAAMRAVISRIPDGRYEFEDFVDDDGLSDAPIRLHAAVTVAGDEVTVDLSNCNAQVVGPVNATRSMAGCAVYYSLMATADEAVPANAGCYRPVRMIVPEGTVVNARHPAPVAHRIATIHRLLNTILGALHQAIPDRVPAAYYGGSYVCSFLTVAEDGDRHVLVEIEIGGTGAHPAQDGVSGMSSGMHNNANIPIETIEAELPMTVMSYGLIPDSGGAGMRRGGLGLWREWRIDAPQTVFTANGDRFKFRPYGLAGGLPAAPGRLTLTRDGKTEALPSKITGLMLRKGDILRLDTSGGGGFGEPWARASEEQERDLRLGYVTRDGAAAYQRQAAE